MMCCCHLRFHDLPCVCCHTVSREKVVAVIWFQSVVTLNLNWTSHMKGLRHLITESHIVTG